MMNKAIFFDPKRALKTGSLFVLFFCKDSTIILSFFVPYFSNEKVKYVDSKHNLEGLLN